MKYLQPLEFDKKGNKQKLQRKMYIFFPDHIMVTHNGYTNTIKDMYCSPKTHFYECQIDRRCTQKK